ncbi:MAG: cation:proton antiporter [Planctomycetales bacterium]|nr:cation:proton antiporter [Planctomycetales bacterium]
MILDLLLGGEGHAAHPAAGPALAAGAGLLRDVLTATIAATLGGLAARLLRQPLMVGYIAAGILVGPNLGVHVFGGHTLVQDRDTIEVISEIGLLFLLFLVGLEIEPRRILGQGFRPFLVAVLQVPLCAAVAFGALAVIPLPPILERFCPDWHVRLLLAVALAIPSAEIVLKLLADRLELDSSSGRITTAALGGKTLYVLAILAALPALEASDRGRVLESAGTAAGTLAVAALAGRFVLPFLFRLLWRSQELLLLVAIAWGFSLAGAAEHFGLSKEMGALLAGFALASHSVGLQVAIRLQTLRDFFHMLFFVALGMTLPRPDAELLWGISTALGVVLLTRLATVYPLVRLSGGERRTAVLSTLHLAQVSVFSLVLVTLGHHLHPGHIPLELRNSLIVPVYAVAAILATYAIGHSSRIARAVSREAVSAEKSPPRPVVFLGFHRYASSLLADLERAQVNVRKAVGVVDWNLDAHRALAAKGIAVTYGDLGDPRTLDRAGLEGARVVLATIPDSRLKGVDNARLVRMARARAKGARIIAVGERIDDVKHLVKAGANEVVLPRASVARDLLPRVLAAFEGRPAKEPEDFTTEILL